MTSPTELPRQSNIAMGNGSELHMGALAEGLGPARPTSPIPLAGEAEATSSAIVGAHSPISDHVLQKLRAACAVVSVDPNSLRQASRDWWPLAMTWALNNQTGGLAAALCQPTTVAEVSAIAKVCNEERIPLTVVAGRSGVSGGSVPVHGGVCLDLCGLNGILDVDNNSLTVTVAAGTFGDHLEDELRTTHGLTAGHWPQSMTLATVGGWAACRGAGQLSTRYGKIEDIVTGLQVVLADGRVISTGGQPRQAVGPDLNQIFIGSEGTLGIITAVTLRCHPVPTTERQAAYGFTSFAEGLDACRRILRRGATPAVLRLYDAVESDRNYGTGEATNVMIVLDEGDECIVEGTWAVVEHECAEAEPLSNDLVGHWLKKRNDVAALESLISGGLVVDTMEIAAPWSRLDVIYERALAAIAAIPGTLAVSAHQSHAYLDGACLYFTFAGKPEADQKDRYYRAVWDEGTTAVLNNGGALSHHHGVGVNRGRFMETAMGGGFNVLTSIKSALDPSGILNPSKLGLPSAFGPIEFPEH
ncbi:MAG TPA: FAD-binding oxidoreductase [Acidimicrobiaceae bacterium]|nr:FAD-binding oxidoreductase [Acidimicrobiaceae bacterium]